MKKYFFPALLLIIYCAILIKVMVFKDLALIRIGHIFLNFGGTHEGTPNFIPFKTILPYLFGYKGLIIAGINLIGNIILLVPIGFIIPFLFKNFNWRQLLIISFFSGFAIEILQVVFHVGIFDIDDVILNGLGVMIGFWIFKIFLNGSKAIQYGSIATILLSFTAIATYSTVYYIQNHQLPIGIGDSEQMMQTPLMDHHINPITNNCQDCDLCGGTGGIGYVLNVDKNIVTLKINDSTLLHVTCTEQTIFKALTGNIAITDLKIGDRLTLIGDARHDGNFDATTILVCSKIKLHH